MLENNKQLRKAPVPSLATWSKITTQPNLNSGGITDKVSKLFYYHHRYWCSNYPKEDACLRVNQEELLIFSYICFGLL
jgi:hypothetical protein